MNEQQEFIERLKSIVKENQIHIPNHQGNENQLKNVVKSTLSFC